MIDAATDGPADAERPETDDARSARVKILDHFEDTTKAGHQTVAQILQGTGLSRAVVDPLLSRMTSKGQLLRVATGLYRRAPPAPEPVPVPAPAEMSRADGVTEAQWLEWLWGHRRTGKWAGPGRPPHRTDGIMTDGCAVPFEAWATFQGELAAVLRQEQEDAALRDRLVMQAHGNVIHGIPGLRDMRPVRLMLAAGIPIEEIEQVVKQQHDRRLKPSNAPLASWADLFDSVAVHHHRFVLAKRTAAKWKERLADAASTTDQSPTLRRAMSEITPQKTVGASDVSAGHTEPSGA